jgi:transcriptional regulator of acetoin/glycerol metabolism
MSERAIPLSTGAKSERREQLENALRMHGGNVSAIAREFGVSRRQVHRRCDKYGLDPAAYRSGVAGSFRAYRAPY